MHQEPSSAIMLQSTPPKRNVLLGLPIELRLELYSHLSSFTLLQLSLATSFL
ncbi:hypothetical protein BJ508DRAFT_410167 [Ascobolus immersus RN42]|uniref:F-box domain-containing protein n=1 Tax=Ascobolus immersus RN42 TaxID=1160509 RepID=A0A3N4IMN5_ASCIM|nr:hypothetical protein BJ508DRAFT_410167 [Ascobolus immersus RN42]